MNLSQTDKLELSGLLSAGHEESAESFEPLPVAPLFDYSAYRGRINGFAPPAPRNYSPCVESDETPEFDSEESDDLEDLLRAFSIDKQGRGVSGDILPSARTRGAIRSELASMGCEWTND